MSPPVFAHVVAAAIGSLLAAPVVAVMYWPILLLHVWTLTERTSFIPAASLCVLVPMTLFSAGSAMYWGYWSSLWLLGY